MFVPEDENHAEAMRTWHGIAGKNVTVPDRVLEETFNVITYKKGITAGMETREKIRTTQNLQIRHTKEEECKNTFDLAQTTRRKMSFTDYLLAYLAKASGEEVLTFDRQLMRELEK